MNTVSPSKALTNHITELKEDTPRARLHKAFFGLGLFARHCQVLPEEMLTSVDGVGVVIKDREFLVDTFYELQDGECMIVSGYQWQYLPPGAEKIKLRNVYRGNPAVILLRVTDLITKQPKLVIVNKIANHARYMIFELAFQDNALGNSLRALELDEAGLLRTMEELCGLVKAAAQQKPAYITDSALRFASGHVVSLWRPNRHPHVIFYAKNKLGMTNREEDRMVQGFLDQFGKFYTREEAWHVAVANQQIVRDQKLYSGPNGFKLFSEHMY